MHPQLFLLTDPIPVAWARISTAALLRHASTLLGQAAARLAPGTQATAAAPLLEFHAESGAPEGALYVDGKLVGWLSGVTRL